MKLYSKQCYLFIAIFAIAALNTSAQKALPTATPPDDTINIFTEEVQLNVMAQSKYGDSLPVLTKDDLLVVESGDPQTITSMKRFPSNVLLLLDTGTQVNFGKDLALTRLTAKILVKNLSNADSIAVLQYYNKIETISDWTNTRDEIYANLDRRLFMGKRSRFAEALNAAVRKFEAKPLENRHLVLVSDGLESVREEEDVRNALQNVLAANITIHVISYTALQLENSKKSTKRFRINKEKTPPRVPEFIFEDILRGLPVSQKEKEFLRNLNNAQRIGILNMDKEMLRFIEQTRRAWQESEKALETLADDTGGIFYSPESAESMLKFASEVSKAIGSQYVITYTPTKTFADSTKGEVRKVRVSTHRTDVRIRSREKIFVGNTVQKEN